MELHDLNFTNDKIMQIMYGEIAHDKKTIESAFSNKKDRKIFTIWAEKHLDLVNNSKILKFIKDEVKEISFKSTNQNDIVKLSTHSISKNVYNVIGYVFNFMKPKDTCDNLDDIAKKINSNYFNNTTISFDCVKDIIECFECNLVRYEQINHVLEKLKFNEEDTAKIIELCFSKNICYAKPLISKLAQQGCLASSSALEQIIPLLKKLSPQERLEILVLPDNQPLFMFLPDNTEILSPEILPDLVTKGFHLDSEKYISIDPNNYTQAIKKLGMFIEESTLNKDIKLDLKKKLQNNDRIEQRLLLQYISESELQAIEKARTQDLKPIVNLIKNADANDWLTLLKQNKDNPNFSYELIAAYCEKLISLDELATAMIFDGAYCVSPENFKIYELNEKNLESAYNMSERDKWLELSKKTPSNLRFFVAVDSKACDTHTRGAIDSTFLSNKNTPGVFNLSDQGKDEYAMVSFGLAKSFYQKKSLTLAPILHLSPNRSSMIQRVFLRLSDFALFFRNESPVIHGSSNLLFGAMHDLLHTNGRAERNSVQTVFARAAEIIETKLLSQKELSTFRTKLDNGKDKLYPSFIQEPTKTEVISYILELVAGDFVDGGYQLNITQDMIFEDPVIKEIGRLTTVHYERILKEYKWNKNDIPKMDIIKEVMKRIDEADVHHYL